MGEYGRRSDHNRRPNAQTSVCATYLIESCNAMKVSHVISLLVFALFASRFAPAQGLPHAKPADVGLSAERLDKIMQVVKEEIGKGVVPGAVLLVARHGKIAYFESA